MVAPQEVVAYAVKADGVVVFDVAEIRRCLRRRPRIVGEALTQIAVDPAISHVLFEVLETQSLLRSAGLQVTLIPPGATVLVDPARNRAD